MRKNIILSTDAYKLTHHLQGRKGLTKLFSYGEPRIGGKYPFICFIGLQAIIAENYLESVTDEMIDRAEKRSYLTFGTTDYFNRAVWEKVRNLGYLPVRIRSVPEGTILPIDNMAFSIESTEPWFADTVNALESLLLQVWYPSTIATRAMYIKKGIKPYFDNTSDIADLVLPFAVNDFGYRGSTSHESACLGGMAHLIHFAGSDNLSAMELIDEHYGVSDRLKSVWATEHSIATAYGLDHENEKEYLIAQLERSNPESIISIVIDSKDSDNFVQNVVGNSHLAEMIRKRPGRVVLRPDSGDPKINVIKYLDMLGGIFGYHINSKQYKVLNDNVGLIQGDGMTETSIPELYSEVTKAGWAADNFITGSGGGLLQKDVDRDTCRWALKASYGEFDGKSFNIQKDPKTDPSKKSKTGLLKLHESMRTFQTLSSTTMSKVQFDSYTDAMVTVFENGQMVKDNFDNVIKRADKL